MVAQFHSDVPREFTGQCILLAGEMLKDAVEDIELFLNRRLKKIAHCTRQHQDRHDWRRRQQMLQIETAISTWLWLHDEIAGSIPFAMVAECFDCDPFAMRESIIERLKRETSEKRFSYFLELVASYQAYRDQQKQGVR